MENQDYAKARERVRALRGFYTHLLSYVVVNAILVVINLVTSPGTLWFYWVTLFWGLGLIFHALDVFTIQGRFLGEEWEDRKVEELMEEKKKRRKTG